MEVIEKEIQKNHQNVLDILNEFEEYRKKSNTKKLTLEILAIISPVIGFFIFLFIMINSYKWNLNEEIIMPVCITSVFLGIGAAVLFAYFSNETKKEFKSKLKNECFKEALKAFGDIIWFENKEEGTMQKSNVSLDNDILKRSALFADFNRRYIDDEFIGSYNKVDFEITETHMQHESGSGKNRSVVDIFKGVIIQFDSNKKVLNRTMVSTKGDMMTAKTSIWVTILLLFLPFLNVVADSFKDGFNFASLLIPAIILFVVILIVCFGKKDEPLNKVTLEDPEFNKRFDVYSSDQIEARYLITPSFMERLNNLTTAFGTKKVKCSFFDDKFMIAISTKKDLFEIGKINKPLTDPENLETFYNELNSIYQMIDYFKLDERIGL